MQKNPIFNSLILGLYFLTFISSGLHAGTDTLLHAESRGEKSSLSADGPYIIHHLDGTMRVICVNKDGRVQDSTYAIIPEGFSFCVTDHAGKYPFKVKLHPIKRPEWKYNQPDKVFVMSDPHGRLDCVVSLLQGNGVINENLEWSFKNNHLVVIGDVFDRGEDVTAIFWLLYKLEAEAEKAGGTVSFLLGNHEALVLSNDLRYTKEKYKLLAEKLNLSVPELYGAETELGQWLATRNTIQVIGRDLYVHAGLGKAFYDHQLNIPDINEEISQALFLKKVERKALSPLTTFLYGGEGPLWYRGLVRKEPKYYPLSTDSLTLILKRYKVDRIIVGHTIFEDISTFYSRRVIGVNVDNLKNKTEKRGRAILIEKKTYYAVGDKGKMKILQ